MKSLLFILLFWNLIHLVHAAPVTFVWSANPARIVTLAAAGDP
jgi:hypothetical protein